jgi:hypothetical protein
VIPYTGDTEWTDEVAAAAREAAHDGLVVTI